MRKDAIVKPQAGTMGVQGEADPITKGIGFIVEQFRREEGTYAAHALMMAQNQKRQPHYVQLPLKDSPEISAARGNHKGKIMARWNCQENRFVQLIIPVITPEGGKERIEVDLTKIGRR